MRLLHTSDWHLGHAFCDQSRAREQGDFLDWLLATIEEREVDALIVAGDVFDSPAASNEAFELYYRFLARLSTLGGRTRSGGRRTAVVVGGNHDSPGRLDAPREVLTSLSTHVVGGYDAARAGTLAEPTGVLVPLAAGDGQVGAVVAAVPFLNDWRIGVRGFEASGEEQLRSMHERFRDVYATLADKAAARFPGVPLVATGHLTCLPSAGQKVSEEDAVPVEINRVGTLGAMDPGIFDVRFAYVALGHIHRGFAVGSGGRVHYSGSPIQVSVAESPASRRVLLVDLEGGEARVEPLAVPTTRRLLALRGSLDEVVAGLQHLSVPEGELPPYVSARVTLRAPEPRVAELVREAASRNAACAPLVVDVQAQIQRAGEGGAPRAIADARRVTPEEAFLFAWRARYGADAAPSAPVLQRFLSVVDERGGGAS